MASRRPNILIFMTDQEQGDVILPDHPAPMPHTPPLRRRGGPVHARALPDDALLPVAGDVHDRRLPEPARRLQQRLDADGDPLRAQPGR